MQPDIPPAPLPIQTLQCNQHFDEQVNDMHQQQQQQHEAMGCILFSVQP